MPSGCSSLNRPCPNGSGGVSYPDISLIKDICEILGISEHELLTAGEDTQTRTNERLAYQYMRLQGRFKLGQVVIYGLALLVCFICNLAVNHSLTWFFIVLAALLLAASLTLLPVLVSKRRRLVVLGCFTLSLLLLLLVCDLYTGGGWFLLAAVSVLLGLCVCFLPGVLAGVWLPSPLAAHKGLLAMGADTLLLLAVLAVSSLHTGGGWFFSAALPLAGYWLLLPWGMLGILRYTKLNGFFKAAACIGLVNVVLLLSNRFTHYILYKNTAGYSFVFDFTNWNPKTLDGNLRILIFVGLLVLAAAFAVAGIAAALRKGKAAAG